MKIFLIIIFLITFLNSEKIILKTDVNVRASYSPNSEIIAVGKKGEVFTVIKNIGFVKCKIKEGGSIGKSGWIWSIYYDDNTHSISGQGVTLRTTPEYLSNGTSQVEDDPNYIAGIYPGTKITAMSFVTHWYLIDYHGRPLYVWSRASRKYAR